MFLFRWTDQNWSLFNEQAVAHGMSDSIYLLVRSFVFFSYHKRGASNAMIELFRDKSKNQLNFSSRVWLNHRKWISRIKTGKKRTKFLTKKTPSHIRSIIISGWLCVQKEFESVYFDECDVDTCWDRSIAQLDDLKPKLNGEQGPMFDSSTRKTHR